LNNMLIKLGVMLQSLKESEEGQNMAEYALVAALVSLAAAAILPGIGSSISGIFSSLSSNLALA
jgi:Flp pilus assembly pilin Flp